MWKIQPLTPVHCVSSVQSQPQIHTGSAPIGCRSGQLLTSYSLAVHHLYVCPKPPGGARGGHADLQHTWSRPELKHERQQCLLLTAVLLSFTARLVLGRPGVGQRQGWAPSLAVRQEVKVHHCCNHKRTNISV